MLELLSDECVAANLKQEDDAQARDIEVVECEVGMAGVKMADGEAEAGPSTRGESEESREAFKVCSSSALRSHIFHAHFVQTQITI